MRARLQLANRHYLTHLAQLGPNVFQAAAPELNPVNPSSKFRPHRFIDWLNA